MYTTCGTSKLLVNVKTIVMRTAQFSSRPAASEVLTAYLIQCNEPPWTSYFVKYSSVKNDQFGMSNFNWKAGSSNYQILRTGCFPYIKYHCSKKKAEDLEVSDKFMRAIKVINFGIPCLLYGLAATQLIRHKEIVHTSKGPVTIYFLIPEDKGSSY
ncbi:uncharacterized protein C15orf61 homolog isoform X1 [Spodoptera litura]|uniref:Uncharacterized protein C15orf61 homolog isoform X1 n=1 Tax=Spodoptera litura TaxID=69820 RepID=A0A9J7EAY9_SPOLT|nr:uncharacterized protein C15orf61 homolog isoform X1 [Spodoptera litura]